MKNKFFGRNIQPSCFYCENAEQNGSSLNCKKGKHISNGKCRHFRYDPLMRIPRKQSLEHKFTAEDFKL